ncbi:hypothetical protein [Actinomadura rudentiformis]|uniref:Uncharacterized protein n=1 Tax=Actinomadura rudentiformis TaxID=359158 RepID=A0A6H9YEL2_9ACTN|nr:hypothetical protein [Actinomadura rudentiformis]KAB2339777.1 hypothetical protein F8566_46750 [Actinomadura rudentiformis]
MEIRDLRVVALCAGRRWRRGKAAMKPEDRFLGRPIDLRGSELYSAILLGQAVDQLAILIER